MDSSNKNPDNKNETPSAKQAKDIHGGAIFILVMAVGLPLLGILMKLLGY
jgi:diacylglycerol kinase